MKVLTFPDPDPGSRPPNLCPAVASCAQLPKQEGIWASINMDGGGSRTLVIEENGEPVVLNLPTGDNTFWKQRAVLKHLGLYIG